MAIFKIVLFPIPSNCWRVSIISVESVIVLMFLGFVFRIRLYDFRFIIDSTQVEYSQCPPIDKRDLLLTKEGRVCSEVARVLLTSR